MGINYLRGAVERKRTAKKKKIKVKKDATTANGYIYENRRFTKESNIVFSLRSSLDVLDSVRFPK